MKTKIVALAILALTLNVFGQFGPSLSAKYPYTNRLQKADVLILGTPGQTNYNIAASNVLQSVINAAALGGVTPTNLANSGIGDVTQAGLAARSYSIGGNANGVTNIDFGSLNIGAESRQNVNPGLKRVASAFRQGRPLRILELGDDAVGADFGANVVIALTNFLQTQTAPFYGNGGFMYRNAIGGATDNSSTASATLGLFPFNTLTMPNGSSSTNISTTESGWATTTIALSYYQGINGSVVVRTQAYGGTLATFATVSATNGSFGLAFTNWSITLHPTLVVSVESIGTNIVVGASQYNTNLANAFSLDKMNAGNAQLTNYAAIGGVYSNAARLIFASNRWDLIINHFIDGTSTALTSNEWWVSQTHFENMLQSIGCRSDVLYVSPNPSVPSPGFSEAQRSAMRDVSIRWGRSMFDATSLINTNTALPLGYYQSDGVHLSTTGSVYLTSVMLRDFGLTADNALSFGIKLPSSNLRTNPVDYTSLKIQSGNTTSIITNGFGSLNRHVWSWSSSSPTDWNFAVGSGISAIRGTSATYLIGADKGDGFSGQYGFFTGGTSGGGLLLHPSGGGGINNYEPGPGGISMHGGYTNYNTGIKNDFLGSAIIRGNLYLRTNAAPSDAVTIKAWIPITGTNGQTYLVPSYQ